MFEDEGPGALGTKVKIASEIKPPLAAVQHSRLFLAAGLLI